MVLTSSGIFSGPYKINGVRNRVSQTIFEHEIRQQPDVFQRVLDREAGAINRVAQAILGHEPKYVMIAARGSSDNAARYGKYLLGSQNGLPVGLATPSLFTQYKKPPSLKDGFVIGISQSGQSADVRSVLEEARLQGVPSLAITNDPMSPLADTAEYVIQLHAGKERSTAACKTYTASLLVLMMLSASLNPDSMESEVLHSIPGLAANVISQGKETIQCGLGGPDFDSCIVIGRGFNYATAYEIALKLKELAYVLAEPYSSADFQHGPVALIEDGFPILAVITKGAVQAEVMGLVQQLQVRGARIIGILDQDTNLRGVDLCLPCIPTTPEWASPLLTAIPGQLFALGLTLAKGLDPDDPRGLTKVTITH